MSVADAKDRVRAALEALWKAEARPMRTGWDRAVRASLRIRLSLAERDLVQAREDQRKREESGQWYSNGHNPVAA